MPSAFERGQHDGLPGPGTSEGYHAAAQVISVHDFVRIPSSSCRDSGGTQDGAQVKLDARRAALLKRYVYTRGDPFKTFTEEWIKDDMLLPDDAGDGGGPAGLLLAPPGRGSQEEPPPAPEAEAERVGRLISQNKGHLPWLRAREPRCNLVDQAAAARRRVAPSSSLPSLPAARAECVNWFRAPPPPGAPEAEGGEFVCWRADFVCEVLLAAEGMGMERPAEDVSVLRRLALRGADASEWLRGRVVAVCTDGRRQSWSKAFLQCLLVLRARWDLQDVVCMPERELLERKPEIVFPAFKPKKDPGPSRVPVPAGMLRLRQEVSPPLPPGIPQRLPCTITYAQDAPWTRVLGHGPPQPQLRGTPTWGAPTPTWGARAASGTPASTDSSRSEDGQAPRWAPYDEEDAEDDELSALASKERSSSHP